MSKWFICGMCIIFVAWGSVGLTFAKEEDLSWKECAALRQVMRNSSGTMQVEWHRDIRTPTRISGRLTPPSRHSPEWIAYTFLQQTKELYGLKQPQKHMRIRSMKQNTDGGINLEMEHLIFDTPVWKEGLTFSITREGVLTEVTGRVTPSLRSKLFGYPIRPSYPAQEAIREAEQIVSTIPDTVLAASHARLYYLLQSQEPMLVYVVTLRSLDADGSRDWQVILHAVTRRIVAKKPL